MPSTESKTMSLAVLMTCFNRREETLRCLSAVHRQAGSDTLDVTVILVDDGSTDGTADAVRLAFPATRVLPGSGSLFWNRGMRVAFEHARNRGFDAYLWLNDDTILFPDAIERLVTVMLTLKHRGIEAILTGSTCERSSGLRTYGGFRWANGWRRKLVPVDPSSETPLACHTMNGNCTLIPARIAEQLGSLDGAFQHSFGDLDYGFRARRAGYPIYVAPGFFGSCSDNSQSGTWRDRSASFRERWRHLNSPKGSPFAEWVLYCYRHLGRLWPLYAASPYLKTIVTSIHLPVPDRLP